MQNLFTYVETHIRYMSLQRNFMITFFLSSSYKPVSEEESEETQFEIYEKMYKKYFDEKDLIPEGN